MAEFNFLLSISEQENLITYILESGAKFVPLLRYNEPAFDTLSSLTEIQDIIESDALVGPILIIWDQVYNYPFQFYRIEKEEGVFFCVKQRHGGPYIDFLPCRTKIREDKPYLISGAVGYYKKYWVDNLNQEIPVPEQLKDEYKSITRYLRSICSKAATERSKRIYWVGTEALNLLKKDATTNIDSLILPT
jgi:hypothetical protein